jgi:TonB family protein
LRNILEYVVPAVLTGLLIVVGLQWLTSDHRWPSFLDSNLLKAPPPSMFTPVRGAPVEVSLLKIPASSGLSRTGKEINERVSAIVGYDRGNTEDWSQSAKKFGKQLSDKLPDPPSIASDKNSVGNTASALSGLEKILPSNALGNSWGTSPKTDLKSPVGQVHLPVESIEDYILVRVQPTYPQMARQNNITGTVVLSTVIGRDGSVRDVRAVSGNKYLAEAAMAAVSQWRYKPFVLNGKPIEVATELKIAFTRRPGQQRVSRQ